MLSIGIEACFALGRKVPAVIRTYMYYLRNRFLLTSDLLPNNWLSVSRQRIYHSRFLTSDLLPNISLVGGQP